MSRGIIINGAAGTGKTTLGKKLAKELNFCHLDLDDYYWPQQNEDPFKELRPREVIIEHLQSDMSKHSHFVMSGTIGSILWDVVNPLFDLAVLLFAPVEIRLERIQARALSRFGKRILPGGDMYEKHQDFRDHVKQYEIGFHSVSLERHEKWASELNCPVLRADGTKTICENATWIAREYFLLCK